MDSMSVVTACKDILLKVEAAYKRSAFQDRGPVQVLCVSKRQSVEKVQTLIDSGVFPEGPVFGENYVQEWEAKRQQITGRFRVHCIGALQSNKARKAVQLFDVVQTVDSLKLAGHLNAEARKLGIELPVYVQVNISHDVAKSGFSPEELTRDTRILTELRAFEHLRIMGLMTITRFYEVAEEARPDFHSMRLLREALESRSILREPLLLSMGMSLDYEVAIEEGANIVRIGSALFGARNA